MKLVTAGLWSFLPTLLLSWQLLFFRTLLLSVLLSRVVLRGRIVHNLGLLKLASPPSPVSHDSVDEPDDDESERDYAVGDD